MDTTVVSSPQVGGTDMNAILVADNIAINAAPVGTTAENTLTNAGFKRSAELKAAYIAKAKKEDLSHNGTYTVQDVWTKGLVTLLFEQNTASEVIGGLSAAITHPAVCIVFSPAGRAACNAHDVQLILSVAAELG